MKTVVFVQNRDFFGTRLIHLPLLSALRQTSSDSQLIVFSPLESSQFFKELGLADEVHIYSRGLVRMVKSLRRLRADLVVSLRPASDWLTLAIGLSGAEVRLGFSTALGRLLFTGTLPYNTSIYKALNYLNLLKLIDIHAEPGTYFWQLAKQGTIELPPGSDYFCLMPGGGAGEFKRWGIRNFLALCERLQRRYEGARFIFILGGTEEDYVEQIQAGSVSEVSVVLLNESVANCAKAVMASRATIANDCGPGHLAQMMGVPFVGIFSNHDGSAQTRMAEWFYRREAAKPVTSTALETITSIPVELIEEATSEVLEEGRP